MRIYIAGPMTGYPNYNFAAFDQKRDELRALGHIPVNPADLDRAIGYDPANETSVDSVRIDKSFTKSAIMRDAGAIIECDALVLLEGWERPKGARAERAIAEWVGIPVFNPDNEITESKSNA